MRQLHLDSFGYGHLERVEVTPGERIDLRYLSDIKHHGRWYTIDGQELLVPEMAFGRPCFLIDLRSSNRGTRYRERVLGRFVVLFDGPKHHCPYVGHRNRASWDAWRFFDDNSHLKRILQEHIDSTRNRSQAAAAALQELREVGLDRAPMGTRLTKTTVRYAMRGMHRHRMWQPS